MKKIFLLLMFLVIFFTDCLAQNHYDLTVGTTRYYDAGQNYGWVLLGTYIGVEEILADTLIASKTYKVIKWKTEKTDEEDNQATIYSDTSYYRFEDGLLYKYTSNGDSVVQDFTFSTNDTIRNFYAREDLALFVSQPPTVAIYDTVIQFTDGTAYKIIWGDDTTHIYTHPTTIIPDKQIFMDSILIDRGETWLLPFGATQTYYPYKPFYFIDSLGVLYSEWNYRKMALVGVKKPNGTLYGQEVDFVTNIDSRSSTLKEFELYQNYPNPFNSETQVIFRLKKSSEIDLSVYNLLGQKVATLFKGRKSAGLHKILFNANGLPSGVFFYRIKSGEFSSTRKMMYVK